MVCRFTDAGEQRADRRKRRVQRNKGTLHGSSGSHKTSQINTENSGGDPDTHLSSTHTDLLGRQMKSVTPGSCLNLITFYQICSDIAHHD